MPPQVTSTILTVVKKILTDDTNGIPQEELPGIICSLLKPLSKNAKIAHKYSLLIDNVFRSQGICTRCRIEQLKDRSQFFCKFCKSAIKESTKK